MSLARPPSVEDAAISALNARARSRLTTCSSVSDEPRPRAPRISAAATARPVTAAAARLPARLSVAALASSAGSPIPTGLILSVARVRVSGSAIHR